MPLVARLAGHHTIQEFRAAATLRYKEARRLIVAGDRLAGIYLAGYAVEMLLKAAYFRLKGRGPVDPITMADLNDARKHAIKDRGLNWPGNLHDLTRWRALLIEERKHLGNPYAAAFVRSFGARVRSLSQLARAPPLPHEPATPRGGQSNPRGPRMAPGPISLLLGGNYAALCSFCRSPIAETR